MSFDTHYQFIPTSRARESLTVVLPHVLERDPVTIGEGDTATNGLRVLPGDVLKQAAELADSGWLLCWLDGRKLLVLVAKDQLRPL